VLGNLSDTYFHPFMFDLNTSKQCTWKSIAWPLWRSTKLCNTSWNPAVGMERRRITDECMQAVRKCPHESEGAVLSRLKVLLTGVARLVSRLHVQVPPRCLQQRVIAVRSMCMPL
jgi:hypothetical protein